MRPLLREPPASPRRTYRLSRPTAFDLGRYYVPSRQGEAPAWHLCHVFSVGRAPRRPTGPEGTPPTSRSQALRKGLGFYFGSSCPGRIPAYQGRVATISSKWRPFPPGRFLLTRDGWLPLIPSGDHWRPFPFWPFLLTRLGGDHYSPFRTYIILYVNGDGETRRGRGEGRQTVGPAPIVPGPRSQTGQSFFFIAAAPLRRGGSVPRSTRA